MVEPGEIEQLFPELGTEGATAGMDGAVAEVGTKVRTPAAEGYALPREQGELESEVRRLWAAQQ
ncbi:hypothetical protein BP6252_02176 [Coleophoma cylindrospora]|uniref:Uncharacterized protein n=1 Tax=Coleophoma cylindrospora TaxID=1849047 RepID=A0A3D8SE19_9HELO|nr:hypothetical protein BP6252_02176 [Coleophoma cylindrospora]